MWSAIKIKCLNSCYLNGRFASIELLNKNNWSWWIMRIYTYWFPLYLQNDSFYAQNWKKWLFANTFYALNCSMTEERGYFLRVLKAKYFPPDWINQFEFEINYIQKAPSVEKKSIRWASSFSFPRKWSNSGAVLCSTAVFSLPFGT